MAEDDGAITGYGVLTWGWSLESGGRDALLDELYVRGRGPAPAGRSWRRSSSPPETVAPVALFLETEDSNRAARRFYSRAGFEVEDSVWMQRPL